jgi:type IV pilus assembly protein PilY1
VAAPVSLVDTDGDLIFDTAIVGDTAGQIWSFALALPGKDTDGDELYDNWFGGRAFVEFAGQPLWHRAPFFQRAAVAVVPLQSGTVVRALLGSGSRDQIKDGQGGTCGLADLDACMRQNCSVDVATLQRRIGPAGSSAGHYQTGEWKFTTGSASLATNTVTTTPSDTQSASCTDVDGVLIQYQITCGSTTQNYSNQIVCDWGAGGGADCPIPDGKPLGTKLLWTPVVAQEYSRFYSVSIWDNINIHRSMPTTSADAKLYDAAALTDANLTDASGCPFNAGLGACGSPTGNGWFLSHQNTVTGQPRTPGDEKTGSSALILAGCALWNTLLPNNQATLSCSGSLPPDNAFVYQGDALTGHLQCGVAGALTMQATVRSVRRDTSVTPQQFTPVVTLNSKTGDVAYSGVSLEPGSPPLQVQVGSSSIIGNIHWLEVPRSLHDCRHGDGGCQ